MLTIGAGTAEAGRGDAIEAGSPKLYTPPPEYSAGKGAAVGTDATVAGHLDTFLICMANALGPIHPTRTAVTTAILTIVDPSMPIFLRRSI